MSKTFKILISSVLAISSFVFFLLLFFPLDSIFNHYLANIENLTKGQYRISVKKMNPSLIFDSEFKGLKVFQKKENGFEEVFASSKIDVDISLFSLITQTVDMEFSANFSGGKLKGRLTMTEQNRVAELNLNRIKLQESAFLQDLLSTPDYVLKVQGEVSGDVFLSLSSQGFRQNEGEFNLKIKNLNLPKVQVTFNEGMLKGATIDLPPMRLASGKSLATIEGSLANRQLRIHNLVLPGPDVDLQLKGKMNLSKRNNQVSVSRLNIKGKFAFSEKIEKKLPIFMIEDQKEEDGYYSLNITGRVSKPRILIGDKNLANMSN